MLQTRARSLLAATSKPNPNPNPTRTHSTPPTTTTSSSAITSSLPKSVALHNWWLEKANDKGLFVGGFASRGRQGVRVFCSAAISKRHDTTILETLDGITVMISGLINWSRTHQNGFPLEVCNHFQFGFPYDWEEYATRCYGEGSANGGVPTSSGSVDSNLCSGSPNMCLPFSIDDLPVTGVRDLLMSPLEDSVRKNILDDILGIFSAKAFKHCQMSGHSNMESNTPVNVNSVLKETLSSHKKAKVDQKCRHDDTSAAEMRTEEFQKSSGQSKMGIDVLTPSGGVATRSMTRLKNLREKQEENFSSNSSIMHKNCALILTSKTAGNQSGGMVTNRIVSTGSYGTKFSRQGKEVKEIPDKSTARRSSSRLKNLKK